MGDLSVAATPLYFGAMALEHRTLQRRAVTVGPTAADYVRVDTAASLAMGVGSLLVPICQYLGKTVVPRRGRFGNVAARRSGRVGRGDVSGRSGRPTHRAPTGARSAHAAACTSRGRSGWRGHHGRRRPGADRHHRVPQRHAASVGEGSSSRPGDRRRRLDGGTGRVGLRVLLEPPVHARGAGMWAIHVPHHSSQRLQPGHRAASAGRRRVRRVGAVQRPGSHWACAPRSSSTRGRST